MEDIHKKAARDAKTDADKGKNSLASRQIKNLVTRPDLWFPGGENKIAEYGRIYATDNAQHMQDKHRILNVNVVDQKTDINIPPGGGSTMSTSIAQQIELMNKLKNQLVKFQEQLQITREQYKKSVEYLLSEGLIGEIFNDFMDGYTEPTCSGINNLINHIDGNDIPAVERVIAYLESYRM